jgi:DNA repair protein RadC
MTNDIGADCRDDTVCPLCQSPYVQLQNKLVRTTKDVLSCVEHFRDKRQEYFICLSLDSSQRLIARRIVTIGLLDSTLVHPREVFAGPLIDRAASVVIVHNHPSGLAYPSKEDVKTTQHLIAAGILLGIPIKGHVIITINSHFCFREERLII